MVFGYWYQADLKNSDCKGKLLYFIVFEDCTLENMCFDDAVLTGARFLGCQIKNCSFRNAVIHQADFRDVSGRKMTLKGQICFILSLQRRNFRLFI